MSSEDEIDRLWREHAPAVHRYSRRRFPADTIDEIVAETFCVAWRRQDDVPADPLPWLLGVSRRVGANVVRGERRRRSLLERLARQPQPATVESDDAIQAVADALRALGEADRELLTLIAWDGLTHAQAAQALGCSPGAVKVRLHRARRRLALLLDPAPGAPTLVPCTSTPGDVA